MKVEQEKFGFEPIHITIYSKEEADIMWAALNVPYKDITANSYGELPFNGGNIILEMWKTFNSVHGRS